METYFNRDGYEFSIGRFGIPRFVHREIAKAVLGRRLEWWEEVHHINGKRWDNRPENLCVMSRFNHRYYHSWFRWIYETFGTYPRLETRIAKLRSLFDGVLLADFI